MKIKYNNIFGLYVYIYVVGYNYNKIYGYRQDVM